MNGGEVVVKTMLSSGMDTVFLVLGSTNFTIMKDLSLNQKKFYAIPNRITPNIKKGNIVKNMTFQKYIILASI